MRTSRCKHPIYYLYLAAALLLLIPLLTACGDEDVAADGAIVVPDSYETIQEAIDAAEEGDIIVVRPGTYAGSINFNGKNITLRSTDPDDPEIVSQTIIDARGSGSVVTFAGGESSEAVLSGFTIMGGSGTRTVLEFEVEGQPEEIQSYFGGGIIVLEGSAPTITNNVIADNIAERGGGIFVYRAEATIENNRIVENVSTGGGGGIFLADSYAEINNNVVDDNRAGRSGGGVAISGTGRAAAVFEGNTISNNVAQNGGGFSILDASPVISNNVITGNRSDGRGGGLFAARSDLQLTGNNVSDNRAGDTGGGVALFVESSGNIEDNVITGNEASAGGGLAVLANSLPFIANNMVSDNTARNGGGLFIIEGSDAVLSGNTIAENYAELNGAGMLVVSASPTVEENTFSGNEARRDGGALMVSLDSNPRINANVFENNSAREGAAIHVSEGGSITLSSPDSNTYQGNSPDDIYQE